MTGNAQPSGTDNRLIVSARIHPAIGIARVGNARTGYFLGPEVVAPPPVGADERRDAAGALLRQAVRFRIYGYDAAGVAIAELTAANADIIWQVEVANLKASWYQFQIALDIPEAANAPPAARRNLDIVDRSRLEITPPAQSLAGPNAAPARFDGAFDGTPVHLGEASTDGDGRLIFRGGHGVAGHMTGAPITTFANNDGWFDDTADGPVTATVRIGNRSIPVDPAWVVVAPPNYAPDIKGIRTMYDLMRDVFIRAGHIAVPEKLSFTADILPIFERMTALQWVNDGYAGAFGHGSPFDASDPAFRARLADPSPENAGFRYAIANNFRNFDKDCWSPTPWPWLYGDAVEIPFAHTPRQNSMLAQVQIHNLQRWAAGAFSDDRDTTTAVRRIDELPITGQPAMLDRAMLEFAIADAFHPGCEMTWPVRHASMFMAPYRFRHRAADAPDPHSPAILTPDAVQAFDGPLYGQRAGWITRWMAVPWHTDTAGCRSQGAYDPGYGPFVPTFWPARVPNDVIAEVDYAIAVDSSRPAAERTAAFRRRADWADTGLGHEAISTRQLAEMVDRFGQMGVVTARPGAADLAAIPAQIWVSDGKAIPPLLQGKPVHTVAFTERRGSFPHGPRRRKLGTAP